MRRSIFLVFAAIIAILIGSASLFLPEKMAEGFGITSSPLIIFLSRELGVFNLCSGVLNFLVRNHTDSKTLKAILIFNLAYHLIMIPINVFGVKQDIFSIGQAIPPFIFHLFLGVGFLWYLSKIKTTAN